MEFKKLYTLFDEESARLLNELIEKKGLTNETGKSEIDERLTELIKRIVIENMDRKDTLEARKVNRDDFEHFFINELT